MPGATTTARLHFDANAILRYLLHDNVGQAKAAARKIEQARAGQLIIDVHPLVLAEVIYVLKSYFRHPSRNRHGNHKIPEYAWNRGS